MIVCQCGKKIEYFLVIGNDADTVLNKTSRPIFFESHFLCSSCFEAENEKWKKIIKGKAELYIIEYTKVDVIANTKKEFIKKVSPQIWDQFKKREFWLPKVDINRAAKELENINDKEIE